MSQDDTGARPRHYSHAMMALHWTTATLIVTVVVLSWVFPHGPARETSIELLLHRSFGLTILALTLVRVIVGRLTAAPAEDADVPWIEAAAARVTHGLLYAILLAMPVTGFLWTAARGDGVDVFGLFSIPPIMAPSDTLRGIVRLIHSAGQYAVYAVVGLHASAAVFHWVVRRDGVMARMLPGADRLIRRVSLTSARPAAE